MYADDVLLLKVPSPDVAGCVIGIAKYYQRKAFEFADVQKRHLLGSNHTYSFLSLPNQALNRSLDSYAWYMERGNLR